MERGNVSRIKLVTETRSFFGLVVRVPKNIKPVGHKWVFVHKYNEKKEIMRYKAYLVAQGFFIKARH